MQRRPHRTLQRAAATEFQLWAHRMHPIRTPRILFTSLLLAGGVTACGGGGGGDGPETAGPCVHSYGEPSLIIESAQDATTTTALPILTLSSIQLDGAPFDTSVLAKEVKNVKIVAGGLECTVPCGFSTKQGAFTFTASATGYAAKQVGATAAYASSTGGCPSSQTGGKRIAVMLSRP